MAILLSKSVPSLQVEKVADKRLSPSVIEYHELIPTVPSHEPVTVSNPLIDVGTEQSSPVLKQLPSSTVASAS